MLRPLLRSDTLQKKLFLLGRDELVGHFVPDQLPSQLGGTLDFDWHSQLELWEADEVARGSFFDVSSLLHEPTQAHDTTAAL